MPSSTSNPSSKWVRLGQGWSRECSSSCRTSSARTSAASAADFSPLSGPSPAGLWSEGLLYRLACRQAAKPACRHLLSWLSFAPTQSARIGDASRQELGNEFRGLGFSVSA